MKKLCLVALLVFTAAAFADEMIGGNQWDGNTTNHCDANTQGCGLRLGWTVYDNFNNSLDHDTLTGFSYVSQLVRGLQSDYVSTNWFLFGPDAGDPFGSPVASGTVQGTLTDLGDNYFQINVTGLDVSLIPNTDGWIIGFQNNMSDPTDVTSRGSGLPGDGTYWQQDNEKRFPLVLEGDTAFAVFATPEPSTLFMLGTGVAGALGMLRRARF